MKKFHAFTDSKYDIRIKWITKKVKHLLKLKSRNPVVCINRVSETKIFCHFSDF